MIERQIYELKCWNVMKLVNIIILFYYSSEVSLSDRDALKWLIWLRIDNQNLRDSTIFRISRYDYWVDCSEPITQFQRILWDFKLILEISNNFEKFLRFLKNYKAFKGFQEIPVGLEGFQKDFHRDLKDVRRFPRIS